MPLDAAAMPSRVRPGERKRARDACSGGGAAGRVGVGVQRQCSGDRTLIHHESPHHASPTPSVLQERYRDMVFVYTAAHREPVQIPGGV